MNVHSLKAKITFVLLGMLSLAMLFQIGYLTPRSTRKTVENAKIQQSEISQQIATTLEMLFSQAQAELEAIATLPDITSLDKERMDQTIREMDATSPFFNYFFVIDKTGHWISFPLREELVGNTIPEDNVGFITASLETNQTVFLDVLISRVDTLVTGFATPIRGAAGEPVAILRGVIAVSDRNLALEAIRNTRVGRRGYAYVVDNHGHVIAHPSLPLTVNTFNESDYSRYAPVREVMAGTAGMMEYEYANETWVAAWHPISTTGWGVLTHQPRVDVVAAAQVQARTIWLPTVASFMLSVLLVVVLIHGALRPLSLLVRRLETGAIGDGQTTWPRDEVGQLGQRFESLYKELAESRERLRASEERFRQVAMTNRVWELDTHGRYTYCSDNVVDTLGYTAEEILGRTPFDFMPDDEAARIRARFEELLAGKKPIVDLENRNITKGGREICVLTNGFPLFNEQNELIGYRGTDKDITERKRAENALREGEARLRAVFRAAPTGIGVVISRVIKQANERLHEMTGYSEEELIDCNARMLYLTDEEYEGVEREQYAQIRKRGTGTVETRWKRKDGRIIDVLLSSTPLDIDDLSKGVTFTALDITERKRAEAALLSEKLLTEDYINSLPGMFYVFDEQGLVRWNKRFEEVSGYSADELVSMNGPDFFEGEDRARIGERMLEVFLEGGADAEASFVTKDGRRIPYYFTGARRILNGKPHLVGFGLDITERRRAEEERAKLEIQLHQSQKLEAVGQLAGGVAHDFNNILTAIVGNVELAAVQIASDHPEADRVLEKLDQVKDAARRAAALTRQLLVFSRRDVAQPAVLNLNEVLANLHKMLRRLITEDIVFETVLDPELQSVRADAGQLEQVVMNLVVNATHAMPHGGRLTLETQNVMLDEDYARSHAEALSGPHVLLAVSDTGHGMDAATLERIFEPFFTTKPVDKGTGLGLPTVHGIVKQSGGHVAVYSEPDHGTTFKVYLPAFAEPAAIPAPASSPEPFPCGHETILLCEDDPMVRDMVARMLQAAGYTVITAANGQEGIEAAQRHTGPIDLLLTDVIMPDMNGRVLSEQLTKAFPTLPTLFISGYTSNVIAHHGVLDEGVEFLEKPFTQEALLQKVRIAIDHRRRSHDG